MSWSSQTVVASGTGAEQLNLGMEALGAELAVTAAATAVGDTLDVYLQTTLDIGTTWVDIGHFTQVLGNGGAKRHFLKVLATAAEAAFEAGTSLAAGSVRHIMGKRFRIRWVVASSSAPSFTFAVNLAPLGG